MINNSRDLNLLIPEVKKAFINTQVEAKSYGITIITTSTARTVQCQVALHAQGRYNLTYVNALRQGVGLPPITEKENEKKITWTLKSEHLVNFDDNDKTNDLSKAVDFAIIKNGKAIWVKADVNKNNVNDYLEVGLIGESFGLEWGGRWENQDFVHLQKKGSI